MRLLLAVLGIAALAYLAACAALFVFQRSLIYYPQPGSSPSGVDRMKLEVHGTQIVVSARRREGPSALIYFGGNAEDVAASMPTFTQAFPDRAIYLMNYRGFGGSGGSPSEAAISADALTLYDDVKRRHGDIVVVGRSLGTGVALRLASQRPVSRLVLVTPYDSLQDIAAAQFRWFPVRWLLTDKFESWRYAAQLRTPTLLIEAEHDEVIPRWSTRRLHARFPEGTAVLRVLPGVGHNSVSDHPLYLQWLRGP